MPQIRFSMEMEANLARTLFLFFVVFPAQIFGIESFCNATSVSVGETASISCHFSEDLSKSPGQSNVNVYLYKVQNGNVPDLVFSYQCVNGTIHINGSKGYANKNNLTDHLEIVIYNATKKHAGDYKCIVLISKKRASPCTLQINEDLYSVSMEIATATKTDYSDLHSSSDSTVNGTDGKRDDANETEKGSTTIILAIVFSILILTAIIVFIVYKKRKRQRDRRRQLPVIEMDQQASRNGVAENNTGVPTNGSVNGQGTSDAGESSNVLLPREPHQGHDDHTQDNNETLSLTKEQVD